MFYRGPCAHCSTDLAYIHFDTVKVFKRRKYCSQDCLNKHYNSLSYKTAVHHVHQDFGPDHPVTKQIQKMHEELKEYRRGEDKKRKRLRGIVYFHKHLKRAEKCL